MITAQPPAGQHRYSVIVSYSDESDTYLAEVPALGFMTYGFSVEHAYEMAREAIELWLEEGAIANGDEILADRDLDIRQITVSV